jgi:manganese-dependent ADP-ribose/CDP-alcohol diphosphatase
MPKTGIDQLIRFGIITDIHFSTGSEPEEINSSAVDNAAEELRIWIESSRINSVDFLLQLGDIIKGSEEHHLEELKQVTAILQEFGGTIRHVIGNHCLAVPQPALLTALGMKAPYYSFTTNGFRFIVLDGMDVSVLSKPETLEDRKTLEFYRAQFEIAPELHDYCGAVGERQKAWLKTELEAAEQDCEKAIILCHFPLWPETTDQKHGLLWNHHEIAGLLASSTAVKACISGHYHYGGYRQYDGIHYIVLPAFVNRHEHPDFACGTVELHRDRLVIRNQNGNTVYDLTLN